MKANKMGRLAVFKGKEDSKCIQKKSQIHPLNEPKRELSFPRSQPLPLPCPPSNVSSNNKGNFRSSSTDITSSPLPLPPLARGMHSFSLEEISVACQYFSFDRCTSQRVPCAIYKASFADDSFGSKKLEAIVPHLHSSAQGLGEFLNQMNKIASLKHPRLCKVLGFHAREGSDQRIVVYEGLFHGSLDRILYGRFNVPSLDWNARIKIALSTAEGLAFLHEEGHFQAMYYGDFTSASIQVNKDFTAKLSGYGCVNFIYKQGGANISSEALQSGLITPKSNVWSFGVILLELLTGRKDIDTCCTKERDIVQWSRLFLADESRLSLIMDPRLQGRFPRKAVQIVANIALNCLHKDPIKRPTMRTVVDHINNAHGIKYSCRFRLREPPAIKGHQIPNFSSINSFTKPLLHTNFLHSPSQSIHL